MPWTICRHASLDEGPNRTGPAAGSGPDRHRVSSRIQQRRQLRLRQVLHDHDGAASEPRRTAGHIGRFPLRQRGTSGRGPRVGPEHVWRRARQRRKQCVFRHVGQLAGATARRSAGPFHNVVDLAFNTHAGPADADYGMLYITSGDGGAACKPISSAPKEGRICRRSMETCCESIPIRPPMQSAHQPRTPVSRRTASRRTIPTTATTQRRQRLRPHSRRFGHGFRSPWRVTFDRATGKMYLGDVGENAWEEVSVVEKGENYGWGLVEGTHDGTLIPGDGTPTPGLTPPIFELPHGTASTASTADSSTGARQFRNWSASMCSPTWARATTAAPSSMRLSIRPIRTERGRRV